MKELLLEFLNTPLDCGDLIFDRFAALPGAVVGTGAKPLQRYVCIPGTRKDAVVLVAHMDTVWDKAYKKSFSGERSVIFEDGLFRSGSPDCGIGWLIDFIKILVNKFTDKEGRPLEKSNPKIMQEGGELGSPPSCIEHMKKCLRDGRNRLQAELFDEFRVFILSFYQIYPQHHSII